MELFKWHAPTHNAAESADDNANENANERHRLLGGETVGGIHCLYCHQAGDVLQCKIKNYLHLIHNGVQNKVEDIAQFFRRPRTILFDVRVTFCSRQSRN